MISIPKVALVGRPNVGKSTLFNRIAGQRKAITDSRPGSTRDRNYAQTSWGGAAFELIDTGGLLFGESDPLLGPASEQAGRAIEESDLVVFVVDGRTGLLPDDGAIATQLRRKGKRIVLAVNKTEQTDESVTEFAELAFDRIVPISAEHGIGIGDLLDAVVEQIPQAAVQEDPQGLRVALVGRPNVGKSSLLNRILGEERAMVSPLPGTTRDAVDSQLERDGQRFVFVDTAGIRRGRLLSQTVDRVSVVRARHAIQRAQVCVIVMDATEGVREMDATIAGYAHEARRGIVIAVNKWDRARSLELDRRRVTTDIQDELKFLPYAPVVFVSAVNGRGTGELLRAVRRVAVAGRTRVATGPLNRALAQITRAHAPKAAKGNQAIKVLYATQVGVAPPTFVLAVSHPVELHFSYKRYLENQLRARFGFEGNPLVLNVRTRRH